MCMMQSALTQEQRKVLWNQVAAFKLFQKTSRLRFPCKLKSEWLESFKPTALDSPNATVKDVTKEIGKFTEVLMEKYKREIMPKIREANIEKERRKKQEAEAKKDTQDKKVEPAFASGASPLVKLRPASQDNGNKGLGISSEPINISACAIIQKVYDAKMQHYFHSRLSEINKILEDPNALPGMNISNVRGKEPYGMALLHTRCMRLLKIQRELRSHIESEGISISNLTEKQYKAMLKTNRNARIDSARKDIAARAETAAARVKDVKLHKNDIVAANNMVRDLRLARNRSIIRLHERLARVQNRQKDDARSLRLDALKAHDFEAYQEMLKRQTGGIPAAGEKYEAISKFLADTEAYLHKLAGKIASVKISAEASKAATRAIEEARSKGMSEDEVQAAAKNAAAEAAIGSGGLQNAVDDIVGGDAQTRYYNLAHSNTEEITDQPKLLHPPNGAKLREYQIVGLQWMISLYNNHLNGILADEMGLGKTVQVMALIAYLMEKKSNFGPHLIIVPNAVIVNWKSELTQWLPDARCVYYVGSKEERTRKYAQEVLPLQFNILVTTYEFVMRDRAKLSKIDWQYIVIDEAQRMKDRQSKLAKDLDKFTALRRLLLSGTPLQNDLQELWSLLNLLLPDIFDDSKMFAEWFGEQNNGKGDDWLETEKRVVVVHRLHQILEPFMLRRQVEDVESKLPEKTTYVIHAPMSAHQSVAYSWIKTTGTLRIDPLGDYSNKFNREWASLQNKCMELRKVCNHPMLSYKPPTWAVGDAIIKQCGKLVLLDKMLVKLKASGHKVLLFSTMTKLLDILEVYLQWRELPELVGGGKMKYLRIDGSTSLDDREQAIRKFNAPDSDSFIFLLSIRAAGRGLNLQSSDTVIIYDPDPNPKNEEQAIARSHRIGQTREVKVFHLEAVTDSYNPNGISETDSKDTNRKLYGDSIESIVRNQIQTRKIAMANEIIDAGRFDQQTTNEERRQTLETMLQDSDRTKRAENYSPTDDEINVMLARGDNELELFRRLDKEVSWPAATVKSDLPQWIQYGEKELRSAAVDNAKHATDIQSEIAALTGTVIHHHRAQAGADAVDNAAAAAAGPTKVRLRLPSIKKAAAMEESSMDLMDSQMDNGPTVTGMTNKSGREEDEVTVGNDEEEEVLGMCGFISINLFLFSCIQSSYP